MGLFVKRKGNGYTVTKERAEELEKNFSLFGYTSDKVSKGDKTVILLHDGFSDAYEIIEYFGLNPEDCVVVLGAKQNYRDPLTETAVCPRNLAGVLDPNRNDRGVFFPDGVDKSTVLYNITPVDKKNNLIHVQDKQYSLFKIPSKFELFKVLFGSGERERNKRLEKYLLSLKTYIKEDSLYYYLVARASMEVKNNLLSFKDKFLQILSSITTEKKVYPGVPDVVCGPEGLYESLVEQSKNGVLKKFFDYDGFYDTLSETNEELKTLLDIEYKRVAFVSEFSRLRSTLDSGDYRYIPIDDISSTFNPAKYLWVSLLDELMIFFSEGFAHKYNFADDYRGFNWIAYEMMYGSLSDDKERISFVNLGSDKSPLKQLEKGTTFTLVKMPVIDGQNQYFNGLMIETATNEFKRILDRELKTALIKSKSFEII